MLLSTERRSAAALTASTILTYPVHRQIFPLSSLADLVVGGVGDPVEQIDGGQHHSRRAEAALQAMLFSERFLHRVQLVGRAEGFDGGDRSPGKLAGEE